MTTNRQRRRLLRAGLVMGHAMAATVLFAPLFSARALSVEAMDRRTLRQYRSACSTGRAHQALIDEALAVARREGLSVERDDVRRALAEISCPICGCPVSAAGAGGAFGDRTVGHD
jgi:hypothetical protein